MRPRDLLAAVPVVALLAVVGTAALPGDAPALPAPPTTVAVAGPAPPAPEEVRQILDDLDAVDTDAGLVVPLPESVLFEFNKADVRDDARATLDKLARVLAYFGGARVEVRGHTDDAGDDAYNLALSQRRAEAVRGYLVGVTGLAAERFAVHALGETQPAVPNDSDAHRQQNRRVEVVVLA